MRSAVLALALSILLFGCLSQPQASQSGGQVAHPNAPASLRQGSPPDNQSTVAPVQVPVVPISVPVPVYNFSLTRDSEGKLIIYYFYSSYQCPTCVDSAPLIERLKSKFGNDTEWRVFDMQNMSQGQTYWTFAAYRNLTKCLEKVPAAYVNNTLLIGYAMENSLEKTINGSVSPGHAAQP
jgi:thiol-disulfide isomerase/thioredoxin